MRASHILGLTIWFLFAKHLPKSTFPFFGNFAKRLRTICAKLIFLETGKRINLESGAYFGNGSEIRIGDYSGIGKNCRVPSNITIGSYVMMAEDVIILNQNHRFDDVEIPMLLQENGNRTKLVIENDVWIGTRVIIMPNVSRIGNGAVIGAGSVVTKNVEDFMIVAGNPAKVIKSRI